MVYRINSIGVVRHSKLLKLTSANIPNVLRLQVRLGLIIASFVAHLKQTANQLFHKPCVITLIFTNKYERALVLCDSGPYIDVVPAGVKDNDKPQTTLMKMWGEQLHDWPPVPSWSNSTCTGLLRGLNWFFPLTT